MTTPAFMAASASRAALPLERSPANILALHALPHADAALCKGLGLGEHVGRSLALITCDQDDSLYAALDHATKMAAVEVVYAKSFYAGSRHASGPHSGEILGVLAADEPEGLAQGVRALRLGLTELYAFYTVAGTGVSVFPTVVSQTGRYLSKLAGIPEGASLGYFIAPPLEAMVALDAALKAARVELKKLFPPPTETNFAGGYVTGPLAEVEAAAEAFASEVCRVARTPVSA